MHRFAHQAYFDAVSLRERGATLCAVQPHGGAAKLNETLFRSLNQARVELDEWRADYNHTRPHSQIGWLTPSEYAQRWTENEDLEGRPSWAFYDDLLPENWTA